MCVECLIGKQNKPILFKVTVTKKHGDVVEQLDNITLSLSLSLTHTHTHTHTHTRKHTHTHYTYMYIHTTHTHYAYTYIHTPALSARAEHDDDYDLLSPTLTVTREGERKERWSTKLSKENYSSVKRDLLK